MEEKYMKTKKIIMITMCCLICVMAIGYAAFATNLTINGTANITSTWKVLFTKIEEVSKTSGVTITKVPTAEGTNATFNVDLKSPGDKIIYKITVANQGTLDAIINDITASETGSDAIEFEISGIKKGDKLAKSATTTFNVTISYDESVTSQPTTTNNTLTVNINYVQDLGQTITSSDVIIEKPLLLSAQILKDNNAQTDTNIDFSQPHSDTNGKGLYYTSTNTENNKVTYYFRGAVKNSYVKFGGFSWKIIRVNEDGSVRLINNLSLNAQGFFNYNQDDAAYVGYMYGTPGSTTYAATHANVNSSDIKQKIDKWYEDNLVNYSQYLADAGFCGDRSVASSANTWDSNDTALGYGTNTTFYGAFNRLYKNKAPQFKCPQENDLYTTSTAAKGNKALTYPIGLITADEVAYAGGVYSLGGLNAVTVSRYYLNSYAESLWTMSPSISATVAGVWFMFRDGYMSYPAARNLNYIYPVINLKSTVEITSGDGTLNNPYVIKTN